MTTLIMTLRGLFWQITNQLKKEFALQKKELKQTKES